jgi:hypothetical protein
MLSSTLSNLKWMALQLPQPDVLAKENVESGTAAVTYWWGYPVQASMATIFLPYSIWNSMIFIGFLFGFITFLITSFVHTIRNIIFTYHLP